MNDAPVLAQCPEYFHRDSGRGSRAINDAFQRCGEALPVEWEWALSRARIANGGVGAEGSGRRRKAAERATERAEARKVAATAAKKKKKNGGFGVAEQWLEIRHAVGKITWSGKFRIARCTAAIRSYGGLIGAQRSGFVRLWA